MSRFRAVGPLLALTLGLAACSGSLGVFTPPGATPSPGPSVAAAAVSSKILSQTAEALIIQESFPGPGKVWLRLPYRTFQLTIGKAYQLKARVLVKSAADVPALTWKSSAPDVVKVERGQLVALKGGSALITVEAGGVTAQMTVLAVQTISGVSGALAGGTAGSGGDGGGTGEGKPINAVDTLPGELNYGRMGAYAVNLGGNRIHVVGGSDGVKALNTQEWASYLLELGSDFKVLGEFRLVLESFIRHPREGLSVVGAGRFLYLIGGESTGTVERSNVPGPKGLYEEVPGSLDTPRRYMAQLTSPNWVFLLGGESMDGAPLATVESATRTDQTEGDASDLGDFAVVTGATLVTPRTGLGAAVTGNQIYVFGGSAGDGVPLATVEAAKLEGSTLGAFAAVPEIRLVAPRRYFSTVQTSEHVYVLGGMDAGGKAIDSIERAPIGSDGKLGAFEIVGYLLVPRFKTAAAMMDKEIAIAGGKTDAGVTRDVEIVSLAALRPGAPRPTPSPSGSPSPSASPSVGPSASPTPSPTPTATATP